MITLKLVIAIIAFVLSSGQIVLQTFQHHHTVNPKHGLIKFTIFIISALSLVYLAKDIYTDFEPEKTLTASSAESQAELDYWHTIYSAPSPMGYCDYLEKYPHGQLQFVSIAKHATQNGNCAEIRRQAQEELKATMEADLKAKLEKEAQALAEKNAVLEQEAKHNAARIAALEQAKTETKLKSQANTAFESQIETELNAKLATEKPITPEPQHFVEDASNQTDRDIKTKIIEQIF